MEDTRNFPEICNALQIYILLLYRKIQKILIVLLKYKKINPKILAVLGIFFGKYYMNKCLN